jgi:hypothetical protein
MRTGQNVLVTRADPEKAAYLVKEIPQMSYELRGWRHRLQHR